MKIGDLVKVKECEIDKAFGNIVDISINKSDQTVFSIRHLDNNEVLDYTFFDITSYEYYDMLKEFIYDESYNTSRFLNICRDSVTVDGLTLEKELAIKLATNILEFYND